MYTLQEDNSRENTGSGRQSSEGDGKASNWLWLFVHQKSPGIALKMQTSGPFSRDSKVENQEETTMRLKDQSFNE